MEIKDLKRQIIDGTINNFYVFYGEESTVQSVYISKIAEISSSEITPIDSIKDIVGGSSGFIQVKRCYVCIDPIEILKSKDLNGDFEKISQILGNNLLIVRISKVDKRSKLYNALSDVGVEFKPLHPQVLAKYIKKDLDLSDKDAVYFAELCKGSYGKALLEVDKVKQYMAVSGQTATEAFNTLLEHNIIDIPTEDCIFDFVDAVVGGHPKTAFELLQKCREIGEPALRLIIVMFTSFRQLLQVQTCHTDIADTTGLSTWEIRKAQRLQGAYSVQEIISALTLLQKIEQGIKKGLIEDTRAVEYALVNIL